MLSSEDPSFMPGTIGELKKMRREGRREKQRRTEGEEGGREEWMEKRTEEDDERGMGKGGKKREQVGRLGRRER